MSDTQVHDKCAIERLRPRTVDMKFEFVVVPVSDVDCAKRFYLDLGWRLDMDFVRSDDFRVIQFTPPGSPSSIIFGRGITSMKPGSSQACISSSRTSRLRAPSCRPAARW